MHTLPLPEVQIDVNPNTQQEPSPKGESLSPQMPTGARGSGLGTSQNHIPQTPAATAGSSEPSAQHLVPSHCLTLQQLQFLWRVTSSALASQREDKIHARVTIAQAILESATPKFGWRSSELFRIANNPFGIMYAHFGARSSGKGENAGIQHAAPKPEDYGAFDAQTWEIENGQKKVIIAQFQRFPNLGEPFRAHALLLRGPRYRPAFAVRDDWKKFAERLGPKTSQLDLEPCGYSTNPSYSAEPIKLVNFYRLNDPGALQCLATGKDPGGGYGNRDTGHKTEALAPNPVSRIPSPEKQS